MVSGLTIHESVPADGDVILESLSFSVNGHVGKELTKLLHVTLAKRGKGRKEMERQVWDEFSNNSKMTH